MAFVNNDDAKVFGILYAMSIKLLQSKSYLDDNSLCSLKNIEIEKNIVQLMMIKHFALAKKINIDILPIDTVYYSLCRNALYVGMYLQDYFDNNNINKLDFSFDDINDFIFAVQCYLNSNKMGVFIDGDYKFKYDIPSSNFLELKEKDLYLEENINNIIVVLINVLKDQIGSSVKDNKYLMIMLSLFIKIGVTLYHSICD